MTLETSLSYRRACKIVRNAGMDVVDGLALTYACADYPNNILAMNGLSVEEAAAALTRGECQRSSNGSEG